MRGIPLAILLSCVAVVPAAAATVNLNPTADAYVTAANPANNYGGAGALASSTSGLAKAEFQSVLRFDLASAKTTFDATFGAGQWAVQSISLQLTAASPGIQPLFNASAAGNFLTSWMQDDSWTDGS